MCVIPVPVTRTRVYNHLNDRIIVTVVADEKVMESHTIEPGKRKVFFCEKLALDYLRPSITIICNSYTGLPKSFDYQYMRANMEIRVRESINGELPYILPVKRRSFFTFGSSSNRLAQQTSSVSSHNAAITQGPLDGLVPST